MLVAPIHEKQTNNGAKQTIYLFSGAWYDISTGQYYPNGDRKIQEQYMLNEVPTFIHPGTIIPIQFDVTRLQNPIYNNLGFMIYAGGNGHYELFEDDGITNQFKKGIFTMIPISYQEEGERECKITLHPIEGKYNKNLVIRNILIQLIFVRPANLIYLNNQQISWEYRFKKDVQMWTYAAEETQIQISLPSLDLTKENIIQVSFSTNKLFSNGFKGIMNRICLIDQELKGAQREEELQRYFTNLAQTANRINRNPKAFEQEIKQFYENIIILYEKLYLYPCILNLEQIDWLGYAKQLNNLCSQLSINELPVRDLQDGKHYRFVNMYHFYEKHPALLDADTNHKNGLVYRSSFLNDNTAWRITRTTGNWFLIQNVFHLKYNLSSNLEAPEKVHELVKRTGNNNDLALWMFVKETNGYRIKNKFFEEQLKEQAFIDSESVDQHKMYLTPYYSKNTLWQIIEI